MKSACKSDNETWKVALNILSIVFALIVGHAFLFTPCALPAQSTVVDVTGKNDILYVSSQGDDAQDGKQETPLRTLGVAISRATPGSVIMISGQHFYSSSFILDHKQNILIKGGSGEIAKLVYTGTADEYGFLLGQDTENITLENLTLESAAGSYGYVLGLGGRKNQVIGCKISFHGESLLRRYDCVKVLGDEARIERCDISHAPNQGIDAVGKKNIILRQNIIYDCANAIAIKGGSLNVLIEGNRLFNTIHSAISLGGTTDPKWHNNANTDVEIEYALVRGNVIYFDNPNNIGGGIRLAGAKNSFVHNNTIYGAGIHIVSGGEPSILNHVSSNNTIANNIIWRTGNDGILVIDTGNSEGTKLFNNLYWKTSGSGDFKYNGQWVDYSKYQALFLRDTGAVLANPQFKDITKREFSVEVSSPAIGKGSALQEDGIFPEYSGNMNDIGALSPRPTLKKIIIRP